MARRIDFYRVERNDNLASSEFWNARFEDIDLRLAAREDDGQVLADAISTMEGVALQRMDDTFTPLIVEAQDRLNNLGVSFSAESLDTKTIITSGEMTFILTEETAETFVYTDYVSIRATLDDTKQMLAQVLSFDRELRELEVDVVSAIGSGEYSGWLFRVGTPPETGHAARTDNPHEVTAEQVGAYTVAETDAAIDAAIAEIPGVDLSSRLEKSMNLSDLPNVATARTNLGLGALAVESLVGTGHFASNVRSTQAQAEAGTDNVTIMTPLRVAQNHGKPRIVTIPDSSNQTFDAASGQTDLARQSATSNRTLIAPTNPVDGQKVIIEFYASGGARTLTLTTGSSGAFRYGSDITALTQTASGKTDRIGVIYNSSANRWDVVAVVKGF